MNKKQIFSIFVCLLTLSLPQSVNADKTLVFPNDPWPPFMLGKEGSDSVAGVGAELMFTLFSRVEGVDIRIPLVPWNRALHLVEQGDADGIPLLYKTAEREVYMEFSDPLFSSQDLVWYSKTYFPNGLEWQTANDFSPYTVGVVSGYSYSEEIDKAIQDKKFTVLKVKNAKKLFSLLAGGRIDVALANKVVGSSLIREDFANRNIVSMKKPIAEDDYYIAFSKKTDAKELIPQVNKAISELKAEGLIDKIIYGE